MRLKNQAGCCVLDQFQGFDDTSREPSQQRVAVVQTGDDNCLDWDLRRFLCEVESYSTDVVESKNLQEPVTALMFTEKDRMLHSVTPTQWSCQP